MKGGHTSKSNKSMKYENTIRDTEEGGSPRNDESLEDDEDSDDDYLSEEDLSPSH